jgi:tetratricopeptide (TPR) repeat protein
MTTSFDEHFERARQALDDRERVLARAECEAALAIATEPYQRALALDGLAETYFYDDDQERALALLEQAIAICLPHPAQDTPKDVNTAYALAQSWDDKADFLLMMKRDDEAHSVVEELLHRFLDRATDKPQSKWEMELCVVVARALRKKSSQLLGMQQLDRLIACEDEMIRRFGTSNSDRLLRFVARAMFWRAGHLGDMGRQDKEVEGYNDLVARFGDSHNEDIIEAVLDGLERKTRIYQDQEDNDMVVEVCDDIIRRYGANPDWHVGNHVARAMIRRAVALGKQGHHGKELAGYDSVVQRYGDSPEDLLRRHAAKALMFKAVTLNDADQTSAEMECYDEVLRRYAEDPYAWVRAVAADALIHKGISLANLAEDAAGEAGNRDIEPEVACFDEVVARYGEDEEIDLKRVVAEALLHKGESLLETGHTSAGTACLDAVIDRYEAIKDRELREIVKDARELKSET